MTARAVCCLMVWLLPCCAQAQLRDPTEPPASVRQPAVRDAEAPAQAERAARLQSVLISPQRRIAVIDGETVRVGQRHRGALVASISPTQVVLQRGSAREVVRLYPADPARTGIRQR